MKNLFEEKVLEALAHIPIGSVATYGQIAQLIGYPRHARQVGKVLATSTEAFAYPCHRVVTSTGRLAPDWEEQGTLLWAEGVECKSNGCVDLKKYKWKAEATQL